MLEIVLIVIVIGLISAIIYLLGNISKFKKRIEDLETELVRRPIKYEKPKPYEKPSELKEPKEKPKEKPRKKPRSLKKEIAIKGVKKIIMIEDDPFIRNIFVQKFQNAGFKIKTFDYGSERLVEEIARAKPDIVSMDIILPGINGIEVTKLLKKDRRTEDVPIIALGILEEKKTIKDAINVGMEDYYVKADLKPSDYVKAIDNYLKNPENYKKNYKRLLKK